MYTLGETQESMKDGGMPSNEPGRRELLLSMQTGLKV